MTKADIDKSLYRNLLDGSEYNDLIDDTGCPVTVLAHGNTKVAIKEMAKEAKKYAYQTERLAPIFLAETLEETINNIQWFLYWHIQYDLDGTNQDLRTPACLWSTRSQGADCKSYTLFASSILLSLGIKHFLSRIQQSETDNAYTHVYVTIPKNQNTGKLPRNAQFYKDYFIIDGTIEINNELPFTKKDNIYMEPALTIRRLGYANPNANINFALGCGCDSAPSYPQAIQPIMMQSTPLVIDGLGASVYGNDVDGDVMEAAFKKFFYVLDYMEANGISKAVTRKVLSNLEKAIETGIEPTVAELFNLNQNIIALAGPGLEDLKNIEGLDGLMDNIPDAGVIKTVVEGIETMITAYGSGDLEGAYAKNDPFGTSMMSTAIKIMPPGFLNNTFGAVFANGFNLSCWNSTYTPAKVTEHVSLVHVPFFQAARDHIIASTNTQELQDRLNYLLKAVDTSYIMYAKYMINGANWRKCSKEAIQIYIDIVAGAKIQVDMQLKQIEKDYDVKVTTVVGDAKFTYPQAYTGQPDHTRDETKHGKAEYRQVEFLTPVEDRFEADREKALENLEDLITYKDSAGYTNYMTKEGAVVLRSKEPLGTTGNKQTAGFGLLGGLFVTALVAGGIYAAKQNSSSKPTKK